MLDLKLNHVSKMGSRTTIGHTACKSFFHVVSVKQSRRNMMNTSPDSTQECCVHNKKKHDKERSVVYIQ